MKLFYISAVLVLTCFQSFAANEVEELVAADGENDYEPEVYADISLQAKQKAIRYDGFKLFGGLGYLMSDYKASSNGIAGSSKKSNDFGLSFGGAYTKKCKGRFIVGVNGVLDVQRTKKTSGSWEDLNAGYAAARGNAHAGEKTAEFKSSTIIPELSVFAGGIFPKMASSAALQVGASRIGGKYTYRANGQNVCSLNSARIVPHIGIIGEKKMNNRWGVMFMMNFSLKKASKKTEDTVVHKTDLNRKTIRLMGTMAIKN